jgi:peptidoglycan/LPS O-acetylase OafA/YrhL
VLGSARAQAALSWRPLAALGEISYSLYLVHVPVILAAVYLAPAEIPLPVTLPAVPFVSIALALGLFHAVEKPSMRLGRGFARALEEQRLGPLRLRGG